MTTIDLIFIMRIAIVLILLFSESEGRSQSAKNLLNQYFHRGGVNNTSKKGKKETSGKKENGKKGSGKKEQYAGRGQVSSTLLALRTTLERQKHSSSTPLTLEQYLSQKQTRPIPSRSPVNLPPAIQNFISDRGASFVNYVTSDAEYPVDTPVEAPVEAPDAKTPVVIRDVESPVVSPSESPVESPVESPYYDSDFRYYELSPLAPSYWEMPFPNSVPPTHFPIQTLLTPSPTLFPTPPMAIVATPPSIEPVVEAIQLPNVVDAITESPIPQPTVATTFFPHTDAPGQELASAFPSDILIDVISDVPSQVIGTLSNAVKPSTGSSSTEMAVDPKQTLMNESVICSVCGRGKEVGNQDALFEFHGQPAVSCIDLESAGKEGVITLHQCAVLTTLIQNVCECQPKSFQVPIVAEQSISQDTLAPIEAPASLAVSPIATPTIYSPITVDSPIVAPSLATVLTITTKSSPVVVQSEFLSSIAPSASILILSPESAPTVASYTVKPVNPTFSIFQRELQSSMINMTITGNFELSKVRSQLFDITQLELQRYLLFESNIRNILEDFELSATFHQTNTRVDDTIVVLVKLMMTAMLVDNDVSAINSYNTEQMTEILYAFFRREGTARLKQSLVNAGIQINLVRIQGEVGQLDETSALNEDSASSGLLAGALAGGAVFIFLTAAMCINRKKRYFCIQQEIAAKAQMEKKSTRLIFPFSLSKKRKKNENENLAPLATKKLSLYEDMTENEDYLLDVPDLGSYQSDDKVDFSMWDGPDLIASTGNAFPEQDSISDSSVYTRQNHVEDDQMRPNYKF